MRLTLLLVSLFSLFLLTACDDGRGEKVKASSQLLDSQMKAMDKARQVEGDINAALKKRDNEMNH